MQLLCSVCVKVSSLLSYERHSVSCECIPHSPAEQSRESAVQSGTQLVKVRRIMEMKDASAATTFSELKWKCELTRSTSGIVEHAQVASRKIDSLWSSSLDAMRLAWLVSSLRRWLVQRVYVYFCAVDALHRSLSHGRRHFEVERHHARWRCPRGTPFCSCTRQRGQHRRVARVAHEKRHERRIRQICFQRVFFVNNERRSKASAFDSRAAFLYQPGVKLIAKTRRSEAGSSYQKPSVTAPNVTEYVTGPAASEREHSRHDVLRRRHKRRKARASCVSEPASQPQA